MEQGSKENIIITDFGQIWLRKDDIIQVTFDAGISINYQHVKALLLIIKQLSVHQTKPILIDFRPAKKISRHARLTLMGERAAEVKESMAFLVQSPLVMVLINLSLLMLRPSFPARCFRQESTALLWVKKIYGFPQWLIDSSVNQAIRA